jgi:competence ComEA-like helix-hairpin-helix protein
MSDPPTPSRWLLRRNDQVAVATLTILVLLFLFGWWFLHGGGQNHLIEIDPSKPLAARFEVDVNTADVPELMQLPGVGTKMAGRIVASRKTEGPFHQYEDLLRVRGIGPKTLEHLRPFLCPLGEKQNAPHDATAH